MTQRSMDPATQPASSIDIDDLEVDVAPATALAATQAYPATEYDFFGWFWRLFA
jgi:hypothetical protein